MNITLDEKIRIYICKTYSTNTNFLVAFNEKTKKYIQFCDYDCNAPNSYNMINGNTHIHKTKPFFSNDTDNIIINGETYIKVEKFHFKVTANKDKILWESKVASLDYLFEKEITLAEFGNEYFSEFFKRNPVSLLFLK